MTEADDFGIPKEAPAHLATSAAPAVSESNDERIARLRAQAAAQVAQETDDQLLAKFVAEERAKKAGVVLPPDETVFPTDTQGFPADYDKVEIFKGRDKHSLPYVPLSLNGFAIKVPTGEVVILPHCFVEECLDHAVEEITTQSQGGLITRPAHRFPYRTHGKATPAEYKAYQAQQRDKMDRQLTAALQ